MEYLNAVEERDEERLIDAVDKDDKFLESVSCVNCDHYESCKNFYECCKTRALHLAVSQGNLSFVELLIYANCNVISQNSEGNAALALACCNIQSYNIVKEILTKCPPINTINKRGETPLMIASSYSDIEVVKLLLEYGADINIVDNNKKTALWHAKYLYRNDVVDVLIQAGADANSAITSVLDAVYFDDASSLSEAIACGWDLNEKDFNGNTALHHAVLEGNVNAVKSLLKAGCSTKTRSESGDTILHAACYPGVPLDIINALIIADEDLVNICNYRGIYPIMEASYSCNIDVVETIIAAGANLNVLCDNHSPLWDAMMGNRLDVYQSLLEEGADPLLGNDLNFYIKFLFNLWKRDQEAFTNILALNKSSKISGYVEIDLNTNINVGHVVEFTEALIKVNTDVHFVDGRSSSKVFPEALSIFFSKSSRNLDFWLASQSCAIEPKILNEDNFSLKFICRKVIRNILSKTVHSNVQFNLVLNQLELPINLVSYIRYLS